MFTSPNATDPFQIAAMRAPRKKFSSDAVRESKSNAAVENHFCDVGSMIQPSMPEGSKRFGRFSGFSPNRRQRHANRPQKAREPPLSTRCFLLFTPKKNVRCAH